MANKITKKEVVTAMLNDEYILGIDTYVNYLENELRLLNKKSSGKKATATQKLNEEIKTVILEILGEVDKGMTVTEILATNRFVDFGVMSNQKISALLRQLIEADKVEKNVEKKVSYFTLKF